MQVAAGSDRRWMLNRPRFIAARTYYTAQRPLTRTHYWFTITQIHILDASLWIRAFISWKWRTRVNGRIELAAGRRSSQRLWSQASSVFKLKRENASFRRKTIFSEARSRAWAISLVRTYIPLATERMPAGAFSIRLLLKSHSYNWIMDDGRMISRESLH